MRYPPGASRVSMVPRLTRAVAWIIGVEVGAFLLYLFAGEATRAALRAHLGLTPASLADAHLWKLVTTALFHESGLAFFFDVLMLWLFVPVLEQFWGARRFLVFAATTTVVANAASAGVGLLLGGAQALRPILGISPFIYGAIVAYGVVFARQQVQFFGVVPIRARTLAVGIAAFVGLFVLLERAWVAGAGFFAAMGYAWALTGGFFTPNLWWLRWRRWRARRRYTVIDGGSKGRWVN